MKTADGAMGMGAYEKGELSEGRKGVKAAMVAIL